MNYQCNYKGELTDVPDTVVEYMMKEQELQGNPVNPVVFEQDIYANKRGGGFDWDLGMFDWKEIIEKKIYEIVIDHNNGKPSFSGDLYGFPVQVVWAMMDEQQMQGNPMDAGVFERGVWADANHGGFDWGKTSQGYEYWADITKRDELIPIISSPPQTKADPLDELLTKALNDYY